MMCETPIAATEPQVGQTWVTQDRIWWEVWRVGPRKVTLRRERPYGTMTATCDKQRFVKEARRVID